MKYAAEYSKTALYLPAKHDVRIPLSSPSWQHKNTGEKECIRVIHRMFIDVYAERESRIEWENNASQNDWRQLYMRSTPKKRDHEQTDRLKHLQHPFPWVRGEGKYPHPMGIYFGKSAPFSMRFKRIESRINVMAGKRPAVPAAEQSAP